MIIEILKTNDYPREDKIICVRKDPGTDQVDTHFRFEPFPREINRDFFSQGRNKDHITMEMQQWLDGMETIELPPGIPISFGAFNGCKNLKHIDWSGAINVVYYHNPNIYEIVDKLFLGLSSLESVVLPSGTVTISAEAFKNCKSLRKIDFPEPLYKIEREAFKNCESLKSVAFPASMEWIRVRAFENCKSLNSISFHLNDPQMEISAGAFKGCISLKTLEIPYGITAIHEETFKDCTALEEITIPDTVVLIEQNAFENCNSLRKITLPRIYEKLDKNILSGTCPADQVVYVRDPKYKLDGNLLLSSDGSELIKFYYSIDGDFTLPATVKKIADYAFRSDYRVHHPQYPSHNEMLHHSLHPYIPTKRLRKLIIPHHEIEVSEKAFAFMDMVDRVQFSEVFYKVKGFNYFCKLLPRFEILNADLQTIGVFNLSYGKGKENIHSPEDFDLWVVDYLFKEVDPVYNNHKTAVAFDRLGYPYNLQGEGKDKYIDFLKSHKNMIIQTLIKMNDIDKFATFGDYLFNKKNVDEYIEQVNKAGNITLTAYLLDFKNNKFGLEKGQIKQPVLKMPKSPKVYTLNSPEYIKKYYSFTGFKEGKLVVQGYSGTEKFITLPTEAQGLPVTGFNPVKSYGDVEEIIVPDGYIELTVPVKYWYGKYTGKLRKLVLSDTVKILHDFILSGIDTLEEVNLGNGIVKIPDGLFSGCENLEIVTLPSNLEEIGDRSFNNCSKLTSLEIPDSVNVIGKEAFNGCSCLQAIKIPEGVTRIGISAFSGCSSLQSVVIPNSVTVIGYWTFSGCSSLQSVVIPDSVTVIGSEAFARCSSLQSVVIPDSVNVIGKEAFNGCSCLQAIKIPEGVTRIGISAFSGCSSLQSVVIPDSVTEIGYGAFSGCSSLQSVVIPDSVTKIEENAFSGCTNLQFVKIPSKISIDYPMFKETPFVKNLPGDFQILNTSLVKYKGVDEHIAIPKDVTEIGSQAFNGCTTLQSVLIHDGVTRIGDEAFSGCINLQSIEIPEGVINISNGAFKKCSSLVSVVIPKGVMEIGWSAFFGCATLQSMEIPAGVTKIGSSAFCDCSNLQSVNIPDGVGEIDTNVFGGCRSLQIVVIPGSVKAIKSGAFKDCSNLQKIVIPPNVTYISSDTFYGCENIVIHSPKGSYSKKYAKKHNFKFIEA